jgi:hypothetical protein
MKRSLVPFANTFYNLICFLDFAFCYNTYREGLLEFVYYFVCTGVDASSVAKVDSIAIPINHLGDSGIKNHSGINIIPINPLINSIWTISGIIYTIRVNNMCPIWQNMLLIVATNGRTDTLVLSAIKTRTLVFTDRVEAPTRNLEI